MDMMKLATNYPEDLTHPKTAFLLGFTLWTTIVLSEILNIYQAQTFNSVTELIASYITFRVSITLPYMYYEAMSKSDIRLFDSFDDIRYLRKKYRNDVKRRPKYNLPITFIVQRWILNFTRLFYVSLYYYIMPFIVLFSPIYNIDAPSVKSST